MLLLLLSCYCSSANVTSSRSSSFDPFLIKLVLDYRRPELNFIISYRSDCRCNAATLMRLTNFQLISVRIGFQLFSNVFIQTLSPTRRKRKTRLNACSFSSDTPGTRCFIMAAKRQNATVSKVVVISIILRSYSSTRIVCRKSY